jgi:mono/diheme cytochrome c family protein
VRATGVVVAAVALGATGCGSSGTSDAGAPPPDGAQVYADAGCASCHRLRGAGAAGPGRDLTHEGARRSAAQIQALLERPPAGMPSYAGRLSDAELGALARYLAAQR